MASELVIEAALRPLDAGVAAQIAKLPEWLSGDTEAQAIVEAHLTLVPSAMAVINTIYNTVPHEPEYRILVVPSLNLPCDCVRFTVTKMKLIHVDSYVLYWLHHSVSRCGASPLAVESCDLARSASDAPAHAVEADLARHLAIVSGGRYCHYCGTNPSATAVPEAVKGGWAAHRFGFLVKNAGLAVRHTCAKEAHHRLVRNGATEVFTPVLTSHCCVERHRSYTFRLPIANMIDTIRIRSRCR